MPEIEDLWDILHPEFEVLEVIGFVWYGDLVQLWSRREQAHMSVPFVRCRGVEVPPSWEDERRTLLVKRPIRIEPDETLLLGPTHRRFVRDVIDHGDVDMIRNDVY